MLPLSKGSSFSPSKACHFSHLTTCSIYLSKVNGFFQFFALPSKVSGSLIFVTLVAFLIVSSFISLQCCLIPITFSYSFWLGIIFLTDLSVSVSDSRLLVDSSLTESDWSTSFLDPLLEVLLLVSRSIYRLI